MAKKKTKRVAADVEDLEPEEVLALSADDDAEEELADNAADVPLFADVDGRTTRSISILRVYRLENGGLAYKGTAPLNVTLDTIGELYGDGIYTIEGLNHRHTVLATKGNIRISLGGKKLAAAEGESGDASRIERLARTSAAESVAYSDKFVQLVIQQTQAAAERERNFYAASRDSMAQTMASLMAMQQTAFQQTINMMQQNNMHMLQAMDATTRRHEAKQGKGGDTMMVDMLLRGLRMGRELQQPEPPEAPPWQGILESGLGLLNKTADQHIPKPLPTPTAGAKRALTPAHRRVMRDALKLYRGVRAKGIDPEDILARLSEAEDTPVSAAPAPARVDEREPDELDEDADDSDDEESDDEESDDEESDEDADEDVAAEILDDSDDDSSFGGHDSAQP